MRIREVILEDAIDQMIEDEAADPAIFFLMDILETMRNRSHDTHAIPRVPVDALINMVQAEHPQFGLDNLISAKQNNEELKALIKDIKDDSTGIKYVYLTPFADDQELGDISGDVPKTAPEKTVDAMATRAATKRPSL